MSTPSQFISDSAKAHQRRALLDALRKGPVTTVYAREMLGISHPGGRVLELRKRGIGVQTVRGMAHDAQGRPHVTAVYMLSEDGPHV
jgi:hypothetical protein